MMKATLSSANDLLAQGQVDEAADTFSAVIAEEPDNIEAIAGLARCHIAKGDFAQAEQSLADVPQEKQSAESIVAAKAALALAKSAPQSANVGTLEKEVSANPSNHQARFDLAVACLPAAGRKRRWRLCLP